MKILHIINNLTMGGAEKMLLDIVSVMNRNNNYTVDVLLLNDRNSPLKKNFEEQNIHLIILNNKNNYSLMNLFTIIKYMKPYDIIHSHLFPSNYWVSIAKLFLRNKIIITTEHNTHNRRRNHKIFQPIDKFIYSKYDKIIAISDMTKINLLNWLNLDNNQKFVIIHNAIDLSKFNKSMPYEKSYFFDDSSFILTMVGSFSLQKDQETIIRALTLLPSNVKLLLVGEGNRREIILELIEKLSLHNRVKLLGIREDVPSIMKSSDIVIVSSNWEGFGLVSIEGMAAKKPVIASDVDGLREVVKGFGLIFKKGDERDLANNVNKLITNKDFYNKISIKCYTHAKSFSIEKLVQEYLKIYIETIKVHKK